MSVGILVVEDDESGRVLAVSNLTTAGYEVDAAVDGAQGISLFDPSRHDLVITDLKMPEVSGMKVVAHVSRIAPSTPVIVATAFGSVDTAVEAMQAGAFDFIEKPFGRERLLISVRRALEFCGLRDETASLRAQLEGSEREIIFGDDAMAEVVEMADRFARADVPLLIVGEPGVGKELLARRIHARSARCTGPFVAVSCSATSAEDLEVELFGGVRGGCPCTGKLHRVDGGTLYLDAFTELSDDHQRRILRALEDGRLDEEQYSGGRLDVRIIAATDGDPRARVEAGELREDLARRLSVVELRIPPLRQRPGDIEALAEHFIRRSDPNLVIPADVRQALVQRKWLGNVRELENACERLAVLAPGDEVRIEDLPAASEPDLRHEVITTDAWPPLPDDGLSLIDLEKQLIIRVLELKKGNVTQSAAYLRIPRHILAYRMQKYGLR